MLNYGTNENALVLARKINNIQKYFVEHTRLGIPIIAFDEALHGLVRRAHEDPAALQQMPLHTPVRRVDEAQVGRLANKGIGLRWTPSS